MTRFIRANVELACQTACAAIGINYVAGADGWDKSLLSLAEQALFDKCDIYGRPTRVAQGIVEILDDMVRDP